MKCPICNSKKCYATGSTGQEVLTCYCENNHSWEEARCSRMPNNEGLSQYWHPLPIEYK